VTGDRPLLTMYKNGTPASDPHGPGVVKILPLSPQHALVVDHLVKNPTTTYAEAQATAVRHVNAALAMQADRYVIAHAEAELRTATMRGEP
jgi:hypothetical protein